MHFLHKRISNVRDPGAGTKLVEYTDKTAAEVDEMVKMRAEKNKLKGAAVPPLQ